MTRAGVSISLLVALVVVTNAWWAFRLLDAGVTHTYQGVSLEDNKGAVAQLVALAPLLAKGEATREEVIAVARKAGNSGEPFEKDGFVWVGHIGLRFGADGRVQEVSRAWSPP